MPVWALPRARSFLHARQAPQEAHTRAQGPGTTPVMRVSETPDQARAVATAAATVWWAQMTARQASQVRKAKSDVGGNPTLLRRRASGQFC
jgi:hypothetical protein